LLKIVLFFKKVLKRWSSKWRILERHGIQHNTTRHNDAQHNDIKHNDKKTGTQKENTQHNNASRAFYCYAECRTDCRYAERHCTKYCHCWVSFSECRYSEFGANLIRTWNVGICCWHLCSNILLVQLKKIQIQIRIIRLMDESYTEALCELSWAWTSFS
jgi:hypothetical protein